MTPLVKIPKPNRLGEPRQPWYSDTKFNPLGEFNPPWLIDSSKTKKGKKK